MEEKRRHIPIENLRAFYNISTQTQEMKLYDLFLYAETLAVSFLEYAEDFDAITAFSLLRENLLTTKTQTFDGALEENRALLRKKGRWDETFDKATIVNYLLTALEKKNRLLSECDFFPETETQKQVAFVENPLATEAFEVFSEEQGEFLPFPVTTMKEAVRSLAEGEYGYCLLPFEEGKGRRISAVEDFMAEYDLKIVSVTPVYGLDGNADMTYALFSNAVRILPYSPEDDRYLELHIPIEDDAYGYGIGSSTEFFGFSVSKWQKINREGEGYYSVVIQSEGESFLPLLVYYSLFAPHVTFVGIYKNLET